MSVSLSGMADARADAEHDLAILIDVARRIGETFELDPLLHAIENAGRAALDCERATIFLYDAATKELYSTVATGTGQIRFSIDKGIAGEAARTRQIVHVPDAYTDSRFNREVDLRTGYRTRNLLTLPITAPDGQLIGVLQVLNKLHGEFNQNDILVAGALGSFTGIAIKRQMLLDAEAEKRRLERDLKVARQIQQQLLPEQDPRVDGYDVAGWNQAADQTGGDLYDFFAAEHESLLGFMIADATGHGIGPALIVAQCRSLLRALADAGGRDLAASASRVNRLLHDDLPDDRFVTICFGTLDAAAHRIDYVSAGQGPILLYRAASGQMEPFPTTGMPMGILREAEVDAGEPIHMQPGDIFVLLTDGFLEWSRGDGEQYGEARLGEAIHRHRGLPCAELIKAIYQDVLAFSGGTPQLDDLTAVLIKRVGS